MKTYNYLYKITNLVNDKIYIGIHSTDKLDDGYFGSGTVIRKAVKNYGKDKFNFEILEYFDGRRELLDREAEIVTKNFIARTDVYNIKTGGDQLVEYADDFKQRISAAQKKRFENPEAREKASISKLNMWKDPEKCKKSLDKLKSPERRLKVSNSIKSYIENNQDEWKSRIDRINHDPEKIRKSAEKHIGTKRIEESKAKMSKSGKGKHTGAESGTFNGYYITPSGKFDSAISAAKALDMKQCVIHARCKYINNNKVTKFSVLKCPGITNDMVGKTWNELGWGFEGV